MLGLLRSAYRRLTAEGSTEEEAVRSGIWVSGINVIDRILQLIKVIILARLLSPQAFGLLGVALLVISGLRRFAALGINEALIQNREANIDSYLNTAWVIQLTRGLLIAIIALVSAPLLADFFNEPRVTPLIQVIGIANLGIALQNPATVYFQKNLNFHKEFVYQIGSRFLDFVVAVTVAIIFRSVWALAAGIIAANLSKLVLSYIIHEYRPSVQFYMEYAQDIIDFGKWMFLYSILLFLIYEADDAFVGWFFSASTLGFYQIAYRYSNAPATEVTHVISRVAFPALSKVQGNSKQLREGFFSVLELSTLISLPLGAGIVAVAPQFVHAVLGEQWEPMVPLMQTLAIWGVMRSITSNMSPVFKTVGRPDYDVKILFIRIIVVAILIFPAAQLFGVIGVTYVLLGQSFFTGFIEIHIGLSILEGSFPRFFKVILYPLFASTVMGTLLIYVDTILFTDFGLIQIGILIIFGICVYIGVLYLFELSGRYELTRIYKNVFNNL